MQIKQPTPDTHVYVKPTINDVQCGRGARNFQHPGNQLLRSLIAAELSFYCSCTERSEKTVVIKSVIENVYKRGGRFLKHDNTVMRWYDGGLKAAKMRVGIAFRDGCKLAKKQGTRMENGKKRCVPSSPRLFSDSDCSYIRHHNGPIRFSDVVLKTPSESPEALSFLLASSVQDRYCPLTSPIEQEEEMYSTMSYGESDIFEPLQVDDNDSKDICITSIEYVLDALSSSNDLLPGTMSSSSPCDENTVTNVLQGCDQYINERLSLNEPLSRSSSSILKDKEESSRLSFSNEMLAELCSMDNESFFETIEQVCS